MHNFIHIFDDKLIHAVRLLPHWLDGFMRLMSLVGEPVVTIAIMVGVIIYGLKTRRPRIWLAGVVAGLTFAINALLKVVVHRHRPVTADMLFLHDYSFPSGHAAGSTLAFGLLAILLLQIVPRRWRILVIVVAVLLIILVGISRIYLGVHYPSDVIAGWLLGLLGLAIIIFALRPERWVDR